MGMFTLEVKPAVAAAVEKNDGYCPCSLVKSEDTKCMCKEFREQNHPGKCHCGRYEKVEEKMIDSEIQAVARKFLNNFCRDHCEGIWDVIRDYVISDVKECSGLAEGHNFSDGDVSLAIGRAIDFFLEEHKYAMMLKEKVLPDNGKPTHKIVDGMLVPIRLAEAEE